MSDLNRRMLATERRHRRRRHLKRIRVEIAVRRVEREHQTDTKDTTSDND